MKKLFISQPINGRTDDEIWEEREKAIKLCKKYIGDDVMVLDTLFAGHAPYDANEPVWFLGKSIQMMAMADYAFFCDGWEEARGCVIEHECARKYDIHIL